MRALSTTSLFFCWMTETMFRHPELWAISFPNESINSADFANPNGIANIFSRVTGGNISEIFGELGVEGTANQGYFILDGKIIDLLHE